MNKQQLFENIKRKKSFLCVGLDTDVKKIPEHQLSMQQPTCVSPTNRISPSMRAWE